jgi:hypothetical protein
MLPPGRTCSRPGNAPVRSPGPRDTRASPAATGWDHEAAALAVAAASARVALRDGFSGALAALRPSFSCRVRRCSRADRSARRAKISCPAAGGRVSPVEVSTSSSDGSRSRGSALLRSRCIASMVSLSVVDNSGMASPARHVPPLCASVRMGWNCPGADASTSANASAQDMRIVSSSGSRRGSGGGVRVAVRGAEPGSAAGTWCTPTSKNPVQLSTGRRPSPLRRTARSP